MDFPNFLRIASVPVIRLVKINETTSERREYFDHYDTALRNIISQKLGFSYESVIPKDRQFGSLLHNGNWSGMVGLLERDEADLIIHMLSITEERRQVIDFSFPYFIDRLVFATRHLEHSVDKYALIKPFTLEVWICLCAFIFILPIVNAVIFQRKRLFNLFQNTHRFFIKDSGNAPESMGEYCLRSCWMISQTLLTWSYTAVLLSFLTFPSLTGVRNIPELANGIRQGKYMSTAYPGAFFADGLLQSGDSNLRVIGQSIKNNKAHPDFDAVLSSAELSKKPSYVAEESRLAGVGPKYFVSKDGLFPDYRAIGIKKGFCCKSKLDSTLHDIWASGIYFKLHKDYARKAIHDILWKSPDTIDKERSLSVADFRGVFILLAVGYCLATVVLFVEILLKNAVYS